LTVATQKHVDIGYTTLDRTMSMEDLSERFLLPMMNDLAGQVAADVMSGAEGGISNIVGNFAGGAYGAALSSPNSGTFLSAKAMLNQNSAPAMPRHKVMNDMWTEARAVQTLTGLLNPQTEIARQYKQGKMYDALGFEWGMDQTVIKHTAGSFTAGTVNGANQTGTNLVTNAITGTLNKGDIIQLAGVDSVNYVTKGDTGMLQQFVVTANVLNGATSIPVFPAIIPPAGAQIVQYQTVTASPANGAAITLTTAPSIQFRKNIAFAPEAITMATADLFMPKGVHEVKRAVYDKISLRFLSDYVPGTDQMVSRFDVLYGYLYIRPQWGCVVADVI
jgi:P22 coat protein - gene protein 5